MYDLLVFIRERNSSASFTVTSSISGGKDISGNSKGSVKIEWKIELIEFAASKGVG